VIGESGTGKELVARAIHANSPRVSQPFVPVDCASLPEQLLESELFGHEKGAFTGAIRTKQGLVESADRGTLFLDEIGELPLSLQVKLLRALQERQIRRVGGTGLVDVDVRLVSATNRDLREASVKGQFSRGALLPDQRDRHPASSAPRPGRRREAPRARLPEAVWAGAVRGVDDEAMAALERYRWPGNVRELQNVIERACALADTETICRRDLPDHVLRVGEVPRPARPRGGRRHARVGNRSDAQGREGALDGRIGGLVLRDLLARNDGNISAAAKAAGIDRKTFHRLINKHDLR